MERCLFRRAAAVFGAALLAAALAAGPVSARFHGGSIQDIQNRIKQAIETAKQTEIYQQYETITKLTQEMTASWSELSRAIGNLSEDIDRSFLKSPSSALLGAESVEEIRAEIRRRTEFDLLEEGNTGRARKENMRRLLDQHEEEFMAGADTGTDAQAFTENLYEDTAAITGGLTEGSNYSVQQQKAMLSAAAAAGKNTLTAVRAAGSMTDYEEQLMEQNLRAEEGMFRMENSFSVPPPDDPMYLQNREEYRMKELPR